MHNRGFDLVSVNRNSFHEFHKDLVRQRFKFVSTCLAEFKYQVDQKVQQAGIRAELLEMVSTPWVTAQLATIFPQTVNGWVYFHWVVAQELVYHDPVTEINNILEGVRRRVPEVIIHEAQNTGDLFKYVLMNAGSTENMMELMKTGGLPAPLGAVYAEYLDVAARLQAYLTPFPHVLV